MRQTSLLPRCIPVSYTHLDVYKRQRLSVDNDEKKSESIETQVTLIKEFIQKHNENPDREYEIAVYDIYSDLGKTGTNFDRPGFERMMNDVRAGKMCIRDRIGTRSKLVKYLLKMIWYLLSGKVNSYCFHEVNPS